MDLGQVAAIVGQIAGLIGQIGPVVGRIAVIALAFGVVIFVHEAGHFVSARLSGMAVHEFSIGFGRPLLLSFRRGKTQFSLRLWPFFSYVRVAGMEPGDEHPQGFDRKSRLAQAFVLVTGCVMNFLLGAVIFTIMGMAIGMTVPDNAVEKVLPDTPAAEAGLLVGDRLLGVEGRMGMTVAEIREAIQDHPGQALVLEIEREGAGQSISITPATEQILDIKGIRLVEVPIGRIGILFSSRVERMGIVRSIGQGFLGIYDLIRLQIAGLVAALTRTMPLELVGPVGVVHVMYTEAQMGWLRFLNMCALLTVAIGFLNLMPIPPLDGSRLVIVGLEAIRRKPFDKRKEMLVHLVGFALLLTLIAALTLKDIARLVAGHGILPTP